MKGLLAALLVMAPALSGAADGTAPPPAPAGSAQPPVLRGQVSDPAAQPVQPTSPAPTDLILPAPPANPEPPTNQNLVTGAQPPAAGQWVYTGQYGWVWMPYGSAYTYVPPGGEAPDMYLYYPTVGWTWVVAPWVWGWGPSPYFGAYGTAGFGWYGVGYGTWYGYAGPYAGWYGRGYWSGGRWVGYGQGAPYHYAAPRGGYTPPPGGGGMHGTYAAPHSSGMSSGGGFHGGGGHR